MPAADYIQPDKRKRGYALGEEGVGVIKVGSHVLIFIPWRSHIGCDWQTVLWWETDLSEATFCHCVGGHVLLWSDVMLRRYCACIHFFFFFLPSGNIFRHKCNQVWNREHWQSGRIPKQGLRVVLLGFILTHVYTDIKTCLYSIQSLPF